MSDDPGRINTHGETRFGVDLLVFHSNLPLFDVIGVSMTRPNSMNRYGAILNELGFKKSMDFLMEDLISPLASVLFPSKGVNLKVRL